MKSPMKLIDRIIHVVWYHARMQQMTSDRNRAARELADQRRELDYPNQGQR